jgi:hypothetical protein
MGSSPITPSMTEILNKKKPEDIPATSWAETMCCAGDKKELSRISKKGNAIKNKILKQMKKEGKTTVKDYYETKRKLGL